MIKIVHIVSTLRKTGPINVLYNILKNIDKDKYEVTIITLSPEVKKHSLWQNFIDIGCNIQSLNLSRLQGYLYGGYKLKKIVNNIKPNIIHVHCFRTILLTALYLSNYRTIATIHCDYDIDLRMAHGKFLGNIMCHLMDFSLKRINIRLAVSELLCNLLKKKKNYELSFVNNGIDTDKFKPAVNKTELRKKLGLPLNKKIWTWAGVMIERKKPLLLVNAIKKLNTNDIFIFCGDGNLYLKIKEQICNLNNVILTGNVDNINEYLQASDYYISTSLSEGLPMSVLEAMSCGLPVILSDIEQHKYVLKDNHVGLLFKTNSETDLIAKIKDIQNIDYGTASLTAREVISNNFSSLKMAENYQEKYEELMK